MATLAEIEAAIAQAEAAGKADVAKELRAYAAEMQPEKPQFTPEAIRAAADKYKAAGDQEAYDTLMAQVPKEPAADYQAPPDAESQAASVVADRNAMFERFKAANPEIAGRYTIDNFPKAGEMVAGVGGGGRSGAAPMQVRDYSGKPQPKFGDATNQVMAGPVAGMKAFGGGLVGGPSPSRDYLANDPLTKGLPDFALTGLGGLGDLGGAALSTVGAGISGAIGLGTEFIPMDGRSRVGLAEELVGMSQFAVPELAGVSSLGLRAGSAAGRVAPTVAPVAKSASALTKKAVSGRVASIVTPAAKVAEKTPEQIGALTKKAASGGMGSVKAQEELAAAARLNPEAKAAAGRLGIELPVDVFSDNETLRAAAGLTRSEVGKEAEAVWRSAVKSARDKADEVMAALDGSPDIASVSEAVKSSLQSTQEGLKAAAKSLYTAVDAAVPKSTTISVQNVVKALNGVIEDIGGVEGLSAAERSLYNLVTGSDRITYGRLLREKSDIGRAVARGDGPYGNMDQATLKRMYGAVSEDQLAGVEAIGAPELKAKLREANQITAKQKALEKRIVAAYGSDLDGSIGSKLRGAITQGAKGDIAGLARIIKVIPRDLQKQAVASALAAATRSARATEPGFGLSEFAKTFGGIKTNRPVYNQIGAVVGPNGMAMLDDLLTVSKRIVQADANVLRTGKANQVLANVMLAEGIAGRVLHSTAGQRVVQGASSAVGAMAGGPMGAMIIAPVAAALTASRADALGLAGKLFSSPEFTAMAVEAATRGTVAAETLAKVSRAPQFRAWGKAVGVKSPNDLLRGLVGPAMQAAAETANSNIKPDYESLWGKY